MKNYLDTSKHVRQLLERNNETKKELLNRLNEFNDLVSAEVNSKKDPNEGYDQEC